MEVTTSDVERVERALIDASTRLPVLVFYTSAIAWLLLGTILAAFASFKMHSPDFLSNVAFLTWGRVRAAHMNMSVYGWGSMAGMGTAIWLMARLCRTTLRHPLLLISGAAFWNLGVLMGIVAILAGDSTGYEWLEFPGYSAITLFVAYSAHHDLDLDHVPLPAERSCLHHAMVFVRRVSLVPVALRRRASDAFSFSRCRA